MGQESYDNITTGGGGQRWHKKYDILHGHDPKATNLAVAKNQQKMHGNSLP